MKNRLHRDLLRGGPAQRAESGCHGTAMEMNRIVGVARGSFLRALLVGLSVAAAAALAGAGDGAERVPLATILASPDRYAGTAVVVQGQVVKIMRAISPNGRPYYTLAVSDGHAVITVFSWDRPSANRGDLVEVAGAFYPWRYNLRRVIVSDRITRSPPVGGRGGPGEGDRDNRSP